MYRIRHIRPFVLTITDFRPISNRYFSKYTVGDVELNPMESSWERWEYGTFSKINKESTKDEGSQIKSDVLHDLNIAINGELVLEGIIALKPFCTEHRLATLHKVLSHRTENTRFIFEDPSNMNNVWAALRTLDTFGCQFIDVICSDKPHNAAHKRQTMGSALGTQKWLSLQQHTDIDSILIKLKSYGYKIFATTVNQNSRSLYDIPWNNTDKNVIIIGNEDHGVSTHAQSLADEHVHIPMNGFAESLNLSAAVAVLCSHMHGKGAFTPSMNETTRDRILLSWLVKSVPGSTSILRRAGFPVIGNTLYSNVGTFSTKP
eukprot:gene10069-20983_t